MVSLADQLLKRTLRLWFLLHLHTNKQVLSFLNSKKTRIEAEFFYFFFPLTSGHRTTGPPWLHAGGGQHLRLLAACAQAAACQWRAAGGAPEDFLSPCACTGLLTSLQQICSWMCDRCCCTWSYGHAAMWEQLPPYRRPVVAQLLYLPLTNKCDKMVLVLFPFL